MAEGGWNVADGTVGEHTHTKLENRLEINDQLIVHSVNNDGRSWLRRDASNTHILTDRDGDGAWESPSPLRLKHDTNQGFVFDNEIWNQGNFPIESGTFTPKLRDIDNNEEATYIEREGYYQRVGNICYFSLYFFINSGMSSNGRMAIEGLPYNAINPNGTFWFPTSMGNYSNITLNPDKYLLGLIFNGSSYVRLYQQALSGGIENVLATSIGINSFLRIGGTYAI